MNLTPSSASKALPPIARGASQEVLEPLARFAEICAAQGVAVRTVLADGPTYFDTVPADLRQGILSQFKTYLAACEDTLGGGESPRDTKKFLWRCLARLGLRPLGDLFSIIEDGDYCEIYNDSSVQIFRDMNFFEICSYSLDELLFRPWWELFNRDEAALKHLGGIGARLLTGQSRETQILHDGVHVVEEGAASEFGYRSVVRYKAISPVFDQSKQVAGFVTVFEVLSCNATRGVHGQDARTRAADTNPHARLLD